MLQDVTFDALPLKTPHLKGQLRCDLLKEVVKGF